MSAISWRIQSKSGADEYDGLDDSRSNQRRTRCYSLDVLMKVGGGPISTTVIYH
jgi:hypothetical protein